MYRLTRRKLLQTVPWLALALGLSRSVQSADRLPAGATPKTLLVYGALDRAVAEPLMAAFQAQQPSIRVDYRNLESNPLYQQVVDEMNAGRPTADLLLSPAMDLQMKLVNDGYAQPYRSPTTFDLPDWARWRQEAFGYAFDPVVMAYHRRRLPPDQVPANRYQLITLLRREAERFRFRVATYDPVRSGAGYLYLSQDAEHYPAFWELIEALGEAGVRLYDRAALMLEDMSRGRLDLVYNVPGRYALEFAARHPEIGIVMPDDYTLLVSRLAVIPRTSRQPVAAGQLLDFLLSDPGQARLALAPLPGSALGFSLDQLRDSPGSPLWPIRISPGLLVYLDPLKRRNFLGRLEAPLGALWNAPAP